MDPDPYFIKMSRIRNIGGIADGLQKRRIPNMSIVVTVPGSYQRRAALVLKDIADLPGADINDTGGKSARHPADLSNPEMDAHGTDQLSQDPHMGVVQIAAQNLDPTSSLTLTCSPYVAKNKA